MIVTGQHPLGGSNADLSDPDAVLREIALRVEQLDRALIELDVAGRALAEAETEAEVEGAKAFLRSRASDPSSVKDAEAAATMATKAQRFERTLARSRAETAKAVVRARQAQLSAAQSVLAALRAQAEFDRTGPR